MRTSRTDISIHIFIWHRYAWSFLVAFLYMFFLYVLTRSQCTRWTLAGKIMVPFSMCISFFILFFILVYLTDLHYTQLRFFAWLPTASDCCLNWTEVVQISLGATIRRENDVTQEREWERAHEGKNVWKGRQCAERERERETCLACLACCQIL